MKMSFWLSIAVLACLVGCSSAGRKDASGAAVFKAQSVPNADFQLRPYREKTLANGLRVVYVEDQSLPYISYSMMVSRGTAADPQAFSGLSLFVAEMLDKGTSKRSAPQIAEDLGRIGADFSTTVSADSTVISASSLSPHADVLLGLFSEMLLEPSFSETEVARMKKQFLAMIQKRVDNPEQFADLLWDDFIFGTHPYAKPALGTARSLNSLKRRQVIQHYLRHYRPNVSVLAVTGRITPELSEKIEAAFSTWERREVSPIVYPEFAKLDKIEVRIVDNPGLVQSQIRLGHKGIKRQNNDFITLRVANTILGGAFASRLMGRIRKDLGLTYGISSNFDARVDYGPFEIETFTKNESVGQTLTETLSVLENFRKSGVTEEEVKRAKGYLRGVFPMAIETAEKFSLNLLMLRLYGVPDSYLRNYIRDLDRVSVADVSAVIQKYFEPKQMRILIYGPSKEVLKQVQPIGVVEVRKASEF